MNGADFWRLGDAWWERVVSVWLSCGGRLACGPWAPSLAGVHRLGKTFSEGHCEHRALVFLPPSPVGRPVRSLSGKKPAGEVSRAGHFAVLAG